MRILMLNYEFPPLGGGGGPAAKTLAKGFISLGYEVDYVTTWFKGLKKYEKVDGINVYRVKVIGRKELPTATTISMITFPLFAYKISSRLCKKHKYEFINTQFAIPTGPLGVVLSKKFKLKNILSLHGGDICDISKKNSPHKKWYLQTIVKWVLNNSDVIVAQSSNTKANAIKYYKPNKEIKIIPLPYEPFKFKKTSREKLGLEKDKVYLISVGRLIKRKGFDLLIKALAEIKNKKIEALIIGEGPEKDNLIRIAKNLGVLNKVHFLGYLNEEKKFQHLDNADIYVLSSLHEGFGIVLLEAMQVGLPIIATNNGGQVDFIKEGKNGYLIKFGDEINLMNRINKLEKNKTLKVKFSIFNKKKIKNFETKKICAWYLVFSK